jgi:hypothetical protein
MSLKASGQTAKLAVTESIVDKASVIFFLYWEELAIGHLTLTKKVYWLNFKTFRNPNKFSV